MGCRGRRWRGRWWTTRIGSSPSPNPRRCWAGTRPGFGRPRWLPEGSGAQAPIRWRRTDPWETGFVDLVGDQALLGQVDGPTSAAVRTWLLGRSTEFRDAIEVVVIDPHAGYAAAVRAVLPDARIAVDHFHLIMLANRAVTAVGQRVTRELLAPPRPRDRPGVGEPPPAAPRP